MACASRRRSSRWLDRLLDPFFAPEILDGRAARRHGAKVINDHEAARRDLPVERT
jgi:hypothetical protein